MRIHTWRHRAVLAGAALALTAGVTACGGGSGGGSETEAAGSGSLTIYTAFAEEQASAMFDQFTKDTGIKVNFVRAGAGEVLTRLAAESARPQASVWIGGASELFHKAGTDGLLEPYQAKGVDMVPERFADPSGICTPMSVSAIGIIVNEEWREKNGVDLPETWADLGGSGFANQVVMPHPSVSGTSFSLLAGVVQAKGEDDGFALLSAIDKNVYQYTKSGTAPPRLVGQGEAGAGISFSHDMIEAQAQGYPVSVVFPSDGTAWEVNCAGLVKGGPADEVENAHAFIDWALDVNGQNQIAATHRQPVNPNAQSAFTDGTKLEDIALWDVDPAWSGEHRTELINRFDQEIRNPEAAQ